MSLPNKPTIRLLIENLPFVKTVDLMLLEGAPAADVAKFIQHDQKSLTEVHPPSLVNALLQRKAAIRADLLEKAGEDTKRWFSTGILEDDDEDDDREREPEAPGAPTEPRSANERLPGDVGEAGNLLPSVVSRKIYERVIERSVDEIVEMEALYLAQKSRIDRLTKLESNGYIETLNKEYMVAATMLVHRLEIKKALGLTTGDAKFREQLDIKGYSAKTVKVLSNPESRHRVISLLERAARREKKLREQEEASEAKKTG